ncbi:MAG TPA: hypothetical protein GXX72_05740 [Clostridiaceae bacterium]|nr:hypothetical protein [Clostridiaceae bacterium]
MKREFLKDLGLADDMIDKIMDENGKAINAEKTRTDTAEQTGITSACAGTTSILTRFLHNSSL